MNAQTRSDDSLDLNDISSDGVLLTNELLEWVVSVATRAPSIHNTQPWRFVARASGTLDVFADRSRQLPVVDPDGRQLHVSAGAALHHAVLALHGIGRRAQVALLPDPADRDLLARITVKRADGLPDPEEWALLHATRDRHTHRPPFASRRLSRALLVDLASAAERQGGQVRFVELAGERRSVADVVAEANHRLEADPRYQREVAAWAGRAAGVPDGVPASAGPPSEAGGEFRQRAFGPARHVWIPEADVEHPDILVLWSPTDLPADWLRSGAALSALLLTATCADVACGVLNQPLEIPALRNRIRRELRLPGPPQMLLRVGYGTRLDPTPRRPLSDVLTITPSPSDPSPPDDLRR